MNYQELLDAQNSRSPQKTKLPIGDYYRQTVDGKYRYVVDIRQQLTENIVFSEALKTECEKNKSLVNNHQLHYEAQQEGTDIVKLTIEQGSYQTFEQLLHDNPAVVAQQDFIDNTVKDLLETTAYLHAQGIWHICYAPQNVFARKGDNGLMLLSHGSFYLGMSDPKDLYEGMEEFIAPEVLNRGTIDQRCDIYSIGKFIESLFEASEIPYEYKRIVKKATSEAPEDRYETPEDMLKALSTKRSAKRSLLTFVLALVIALICVGLYFELFPETEQVEFVKPAPKTEKDEMIDEGFDAQTELGVITNDSVISPEDAARQQAYDAKVEAIFRKNYTKRADQILSKIYNKEYMNASEKQFLAASNSVTQELITAQMELAGEAGLDAGKSQRIASEIIETLTEKKKAALRQYGIQK